MTVAIEIVFAIVLAVVILAAAYFIRIRSRINSCIQAVKDERALRNPEKADKNTDYDNRITVLLPSKKAAYRKRLEAPSYRYTLSAFDNGYRYADETKISPTAFKTVPLQNNLALITAADNAVASVTSNHFHKWYDEGNLIVTDNVALIQFRKNIISNRD
ncbi:MAG: hypothetical protein IJ168_00205 [Eubacterium sp.]|nr:hypothetical protein [Eubacterium sp.]